MNPYPKQIVSVLIIAFLFVSSGAEEAFSDTGLKHRYEKEMGHSYQWFYGNWKVAYQDKELGEVTGIARVVEGGLEDITVALTHPKTKNVYYLRSEKVEFVPEYDNPEYVRIDFIGQSPPSGADETGASPAMKDVRDSVTSFTVPRGGKLTVRYEEESDEEDGEPIIAEKTAGVKDSEVSEGVLLTVELRMPGGKPSEKLTGTWSYACDKSRIKYHRAGTHHEESTGRSSGTETWSRPDPIVTSAAAHDTQKRYVLFQGTDLPVQPGRTLKIQFEDPKVNFTGVYETDPKDAAKLYAEVSLELGMRRWGKKATLNGWQVYCDMNTFYPILVEREMMLKRKEADEKLAQLQEAYHEAYNSGDRAEAMRISEKMDDHKQKTAKWFKDTEEEKKKAEEEQAVRTKLVKEIKREAFRIAGPKLSDVEVDQAFKDGVTGTTKYVSLGSTVQDEMKKETKKAKRELIEADATMEAVDKKLKSAGSERERKILWDLRDNAALKKKAAEQYLSDADKVAAAGYAADVVLTVSGGKLISIVGRKQIAKETAKQAAKKTATTTSKKVTAEKAAQVTGKGPSGAPAKTPVIEPPVDPGAKTILNKPLGKGAGVEGTEKIAAKGGAAKTPAAKPPADPGAKTIFDKPLGKGTGAGKTPVKTAGGKTPPAAGSQSAAEAALRAENTAAERALSERLSRAAADAEKAFRKATKEGIELSEAESARLVDAIVANNYNKSMNTLIKQARKLGVSETTIAEAAKGASFMPTKGGSVALADLQRAIARASNHKLVSGKQASEVLQTITRVQTGHAGKGEVEFLRKAIAKGSKNGKDYFDELGRTGTVRQYEDLSTSGYEALANRSEIEALKKFAKQNGLID